MNYEYNVWVPTGYMNMYRVFSATPLKEEEIKRILLEQMDNEERDWGEWDDECYADVTLADWEVEGPYKNEKLTL